MHGTKKTVQNAMSRNPSTEKPVTCRSVVGDKVVATEFAVRCSEDAFDEGSHFVIVRVAPFFAGLNVNCTQTPDDSRDQPIRLDVNDPIVGTKC